MPQITPKEALQLVQPFFPKEWSEVKPEDVTLRVIA